VLLAGEIDINYVC